MGEPLRPWPLLIAAGVGLAALAAFSSADAAVITSSGPLVQIHISRVLNLDCQVMYAGVNYAGGESDGEFWGDGNPATSNSCGTFLRAGSVTYGPNVAAYAIAGNPPAVEFTPVLQSPVSGAGTASDPYTVVTSVLAGPLIALEQTDRYLVGDGHYTTTMRITNNGPPEDFVLYRAGDCYLTPTQASGDSGDYGFGWRDGTTNAVACTEVPMGTSGRVIGWIPATSSVGAPDGFEGMWDDAFWHPANGVPYPNTCMCYVGDDNGGGLSWSFNLTTGANATVSMVNLFSATGIPVPPVPPIPPLANFSHIAMDTCTDHSVQFLDRSSDVDGTIVSRLWRFHLPSGVVESSETSPRYTFPAAGTYQVDLVVTDSQGLQATRTVLVQSAGERNCCPTMGGATGFHMAFEGATVSFRLATMDEDGDPVTLAAGTLPDRARFNAGSGLFEWATQAGDAGRYELPFTATDGACASVATVGLWIRSVPPRSQVLDTDQDGIADSADVCPGVPDHAQADRDHDGTGDACDRTPCGVAGCDGPLQRPEPPSPVVQDSDMDGIADPADLCPSVPDHAQADLDGDRTGDACDADLDGDGILEAGPGVVDNCPFQANHDQADADGDGLGDRCEGLAPAYAVLAATPEAGKGSRADVPFTSDNALLAWSAGGLATAVPLLLALQALRRRPPIR